VTPIIGIPAWSNRGRTGELGARATYTSALLAAGGTPVLVPSMPARCLTDALSRLDGLLLAGGGDVAPGRYGAKDRGHCLNVDPERDDAELHLTRLALDLGMPILAICRGIQVLNVAAGGTLVQDIPSQWPGALCHASAPGLAAHHRAHTVRLSEGSRLACVYDIHGEVWVNSRHHQAVLDVAPGLVAVAHAPDGIVEGLESREDGATFVVGVQWHPEDLAPVDATTRALFSAFVEACAREDA